MIVRCYFVCEICRHPHTLRISVGPNSFQKHSFACRNCGELIEVGMKVDYKTTSTEPVALSNCVPSSEEGSIVNLNPTLVVPDELQGRDGVFPSIHEMQRLLTQDSTLKNEIMEPDAQPAHDIMAEWERRGRPPPGVAHDWEFAKRVWSMFLKGRHDVCADYILREHARFGFDEAPHPYEVIYGVCAKLGRRHAKDVFDALHTEWASAETKQPNQLKALRFYFLDQHCPGFLLGSLVAISEYMDHYSEFSQVLIYQDRKVKIDDGFSPSSTAFNDTKMFYGNAFEHLASFLVLPACLNNVVEGRAYDTFEKLTIAAYLELDKAVRHNAFKDNPQLAVVAEGLNNQIRNASHHGNIQFNSKSGLVAYRPTKRGGLKHIKYADYLTLCNTIIQTIAGLVCFVVAELRPDEPGSET